MSRRFAGKTAIITGSSNGIGRETAVLFASEGAQVTITGRSAAALKETKTEILAVGGKDSDIVEVVGDLTEDATQKEIVEKTVAKFGKIDILVNNAGAAGPDGAGMMDGAIETLDYVIKLNTRSVVTFTNLVLPYLEQTKGDVVMVSSIAALNFATYRSPFYCMSKAALDSFTRSMALQYISKGVRFNTVNPGAVETKFINKTGVPEEVSKKIYQAYGADTSRIPIGRVGTPRDIANSIAFLADRKVSEFIIGLNLIADGGTHIMNPAMSVPFPSADKV